MALSNIFREPRREITETVVGVAFVALPIGADALFGRWFAYHVAERPSEWFSMLVIGMLVGMMGLLLTIGAAMFIHLVGEDLCNALDDRGIRLRPVRRP